MIRHGFARFILTLALVFPMGASPARAVPFPITSAPLRSPQVALAAGPLAAYLADMGEAIDPAAHQRSVELFLSTVPDHSPFTIQMEVGPYTPGVTLSLYNGYDANPAPVPIFPATAETGWFAVCTFRNNPTRVVVNLLDQNAVLKASTTTLGFNRNGFGFMASGPHGTVYSQDARNPGGSASVLAFAGTGIHVGTAWLAFETEPGLSPMPDFFDVMLFVEVAFDSVTPVQRTSWGVLKSRFR